RLPGADAGAPVVRHRVRRRRACHHASRRSARRRPRGGRRDHAPARPGHRAVAPRRRESPPGAGNPRAPRGGPGRHRQPRRRADGSGFRSMLVAPLIRGEHAIGAISVLRHDVHEFSAHEEELLVALASQAAIALEHARLYTELEGMVADRTRELDAQKRFVEVVLETMPIGVLVLDGHLNVVRINRAGARALACASDAHGPLARFLPGDTGAPVLEFLGAAFNSRRGGSVEGEMIIAGDAKIFRFTVAPVVASSDRGAYAVVLVEDITSAKGLERQMLLTERLTTAGRLAAGVAPGL